MTAPRQTAASLRPFIEEYNRYLAFALEHTDDPIVAKLFRPLNPEPDEMTFWAHSLSELRIAQSGLLSYLKTHA